MKSANNELTDRQRARRRSVVDAGIALASEGGYEAVQMRDVSERAGVALGTIYNYFSSKDHLLAATQVEWVRELAVAVEANPPEGHTTLVRVLDLLRRTTGAMAQHRNVSAAMLGGILSEGPEVAVCQQEMHEAFSRMLSSAFDPEVDEVDRQQVIRSIEHVWFSCLIGWKNGWMPFDQAVSELEDLARLLLRDQP